MCLCLKNKPHNVYFCGLGDILVQHLKQLPLIYATVQRYHHGVDKACVKYVPVCPPNLSKN